MIITRRKLLLGGSAVLAASAVTKAQSTISGSAKPRVVIIGGGAGGATAARYIAKGSDGKVDVTLVEANKNYHTCFFSNLYIGGFRTYDSLTHSYDKLQSEYGIKVVHDRAISIDRDSRKIDLENSVLDYDILILSPGIDFKEGSVNGWSLADQELMPHAYKGGEQVRLLKSQIEAMPEGGVFAIIPPAGSYRCPPGPYERVSMAASMLKQKNPTAKIILADPKPVFSKMGLFREGWKAHYKGMIDKYSDVDMSAFSVNPKEMTINLEGETIKVDACNVIPAQKAGQIAHMAGVTDGDWAPVYAKDMQSKLDENIYVLGDSAEQGDMPKSGFSANSQAKVCANAVLGKLIGSSVFPARFMNTCWSMISSDNSVKIGATYQATPEKIAKVEGFVSDRGEDQAMRKSTFDESVNWYSSMTSDMFG